MCVKWIDVGRKWYRPWEVVANTNPTAHPIGEVPIAQLNMPEWWNRQTPET